MLYGLFLSSSYSDLQIIRSEVALLCKMTLGSQNRGAAPRYDSECFQINPLPAELFNWNFHQLEVVFCWHHPQREVGGNYS